MLLLQLFSNVDEPLQSLHQISPVTVSQVLGGAEPLDVYGLIGPCFQRCSTFMIAAKSAEEVGLLCTELLKICPPLSQWEQASSSLGNLVLI